MAGKDPFKGSSFKNLDFDAAKEVAVFDKAGSDAVKQFSKKNFFK